MMNGQSLDPTAVLYLTAEIVLVAAVILALFRLRRRFGLGLLYIFVGSNQYLQTVLASAFYVDLGAGVSVSPGSVVLFSSSLFAVLLTYLRESIPKTRTLIYGIVLSNLTLTALAWLTDHQLKVLPNRNVLGVPAELFRLEGRLFLVGTTTLVIDSFLIVILYEVLLRKAERLPRLARLTTAMLLVLYIDALIFTTASFWHSPIYGQVLTSQLLGKTLAGLIFGGMLHLYLTFWSRGRREPTRDPGTGPLSILTYRERYEVVKKQLEVEKAANLAKSRFLAHMSHELRTPMNAVIGFTAVLRKNKAGNLRPKDLLYLERIGANARHLLGLINDVLDLSKLEAGRLELQRTEESLNALVTRTVEDLGVQAQERHLELVAEVPDFEVIGRVDRSRLKQVLINLIGNALKFTEQGRVTVRLVADATTRQPRRIEVEDTGPGIPRDQLDRIFQAFEQVDSGADRRYGGTGLGLAITRALSERMGFRVEVVSEVGRGSTFRVVMR